MTLQELARDEVVTASPDTEVPELARRMRDEGVGSVVVTDRGEPTGIVTDRDLATRLVAEERRPDGKTAADVMTADLCTADAETGFYEAARMMRDNAVRRLPVCNDGGELAGIITADDMTEFLTEEQGQLAKIIEAQRPAY